MQTEKNATKTNRMTVAWMRQTSQGMHMKCRWNVTTNNSVSCTWHEHECQAYKITTLAILSNFPSFLSLLHFCRCFFIFQNCSFFYNSEKKFFIRWCFWIFHVKNVSKCCCLLFLPFLPSKQLFTSECRVSFYDSSELCIFFFQIVN